MEPKKNTFARGLCAQSPLANLYFVSSLSHHNYCMCTFSDFDWKKKPEFKIWSKFFSELVAVYPLPSTVRHYHTGTFFNLVGSMLNKVLPNEMNKMEFGCKFEGRLDSVYLVPTPEAAFERMLGRLADSLRRRFENEKTFRLNEDDVRLVLP